MTRKKGRSILNPVLHAVGPKEATIIESLLDKLRRADRANSMATEERAGLIGGEIFSRFKVAFDYSRKTMHLSKNSRYENPFEFDASGLLLTALPPDFGSFKVQRVYPNTPAAESGLMEGDVIVAILDRPSNEYSLHQLRVLLREPGKAVRVQVRRNEAIQTVELRLHRLI